MRELLALCTVFAVGAASAEGPGTRLRTTPEVPQAMQLSQPPAPRAPAKPCDGLRGDERERCPRQNQERLVDPRGSGPGATGMASGAATSTNSAAGAANGGTAPR
jgi:hypothetical protein